MVNVNSVKYLVEVISDKFQSGGITPADYNAIFEAVNIDFLKYYIGLPESYSPNNPTSPLSYQITQAVTDRVSPFITKVEISKNNDGYFVLPSDYFAFSSLRYKYIVNGDCDEQPSARDVGVEIIMDDEINERLDNTIVPPTFIYPIGCYYSYGIKLYPEQISKVTLTYIRVPATPVWGFTITNDEPVYNPLTSVNFEYPANTLNDLAIRVCRYLSINIREEELYQMSMERQKTGT